MTAEETLAKIKTLFERDEEQEVLIIGFRAPGMQVARCPSCHGLIDEHIPPTRYYRFCYHCGQRLKWEGVEIWRF